MSYSKQTVTSKLLTLLGRRTKKSSTDVLSERTERSDRSPSPVSLSAELSHSDSDSLAAYASSEPAAWVCRHITAPQP
ncbi:hypothetical protein BVRB_036680 [Beta vulgaris subsp. vulgaris]|uniref:Uncharacterized protein n=1 Tax=Beta vulgaris subsp. vulgaris TaxID=3555 RepID=A0A0J8BI33_BETVV|nr:hypothetical protein BVRB_036680 [Beta vulgaris subsp. vulgaris]